MDFARQATAELSHRLALAPCDAGSMLMHANNGGVDRLDSGIMGSGSASMMRPQTPARRQRTNRL